MQAHGWRRHDVMTKMNPHEMIHKVEKLLTSATFSGRPCFDPAPPDPAQVVICAVREEEGQRFDLRLYMTEDETENLVHRLQSQLRWLKTMRASKK